MRPQAMLEAPPFVLTLLVLVLSGCSLWAGGGDCDEAQIARDLAEIRVQIDTVIGEAEATDISACRALPLGEKACGGPATFVVYSIASADVDRLEALAVEYDRIDRKANRACGRVSDCALVAPPDLVLRDGRCQEAR